MRKKIYFFLTRVSAWLDKFRFVLYQEPLLNSNLPYESLAPIEDADEDKKYQEALEWAFENRKAKRIRNVALTGPYGSGKSSILQTFQKNTTNKGLKFLNISLATFKKIHKNDDSVDPAELQRLIEVSVLQQILYRERDDKIPDSRFRKIKSYSNNDIMLTALVMLLIVLASINFFNPHFVYSFFNNYFFPYRVRNVIHYLTYFTLLIGLYLVLMKSIRMITSLKVSKLAIQNAEIELESSSNKSIFNHHLDELLYFFEVTDYNVVVIEDLDRFEETEIFTKLRELNFILNNSEKTKSKEIVFLYAIRDDIFTDKERTKFFDFIIPVIPVINSSNSAQKFIAKQAQLKAKFSENFIESLSLFVDDMRLLHNIANEFNIYREKLDSELIHDKLLAIIVYKNLHPDDFDLLSKGQGKLYRWLSSKPQIISDELQTIDERIASIKVDIKILDDLKLVDIRELRSLYVLQAIKSLHNFVNFITNGSVTTIDELLSDEKFEYLVNNSVQYQQRQMRNYNNEYTVTAELGKTFIQIEKNVGGRTYLQRKKDIDDYASGRSNNLRRELEKLDEKKGMLRRLKLKELLASNEHYNWGSEGDKPSDLVSVLLRNGYISEDYVDYISIFYEGSITRGDNKYLLAVKSQRNLGFDYKLTKVDKVIEKLSAGELESTHSMNFDLFQQFIGNPEYQRYENYVLKRISEGDSLAMSFLEGFLACTVSIDKFVNHIAAIWPSYWSAIESSLTYTDERKREYLRMVLMYANLSDLEKLAKASNMVKILEENPRVLSIIEDEKRLKQIFTKLMLKPTGIDFDNSSKPMVDFVYQGSWYSLTPRNIEGILRSQGAFNQVKFDNSNFDLIAGSKCDALIKYVLSNVNAYLVNTYFLIPTNLNEDEEAYVSLLNNDDISDENLERLIETVATMVSELSAVQNIVAVEKLLLKSKITPNWGNVFTAFNGFEKQLSKPLVAYLSAMNNATELSKTKVDSISQTDEFIAFYKQVVSSDAIDDGAYLLLIKANAWRLTDIPLADLSYEKAEALINNKDLKFGTEYFHPLKDTFSDLHIRFLARNKKDFFDDFGSFPIDSDDVEAILNESLFTNNDKQSILQKLSAETIASDSKSLVAIGRLILKDKSFEVSDVILLKTLLCQALPINERIDIFNIKHSRIISESLPSILASFGNPYADIAINGKRPLLDGGARNKLFAEILLSKEYISSFDVGKDGVRIATFRQSEQ